MRDYLTEGVFLCLSAYAHAPMVIFNRLIPSKHTRRFTAILSDVLKALAFSITNPIFSHIFTLGRSLAFVSYRIVHRRTQNAVITARGLERNLGAYGHCLGEHGRDAGEQIRDPGANARDPCRI